MALKMYRRTMESTIAKVGDDKYNEEIQII